MTGLKIITINGVAVNFAYGNLNAYTPFYVTFENGISFEYSGRTGNASDRGYKKQAVIQLVN